MPHPLEKLLKGLRKSYAETIRATIVAKLPDGDYTCTLVDTGEDVRASRGNIATDLTAGQLVLLGRPDSTGRSYNTGYVILGFPPGAAKGASGAPPATGTKTQKGASVSMLRPNPAAMDAGGSAIAVDIYGTGLETAPTYGDPLLTDDSAPVIDPDGTHIALSVKAGGALGAGDYDLTIPDVPQSIAGYFQVSVPPPPPAPDGLWVFYYDTSPKAARIRVSDMSVLSTYVGGASWFADILALGGKIWARFDDGKLLKIDAPTGNLDQTFTGLLSLSAIQSSHDSSKLYFAVAPRTVVIFDTSSLTESSQALSLSITNILSVDADDATHSLFVGAGAAGIFSYSTAGWALQASNTGYTVYQTCHDGTYVYAITKGATNQNITKFLKSDLSFVAQSASIAPAATADASVSLFLLDGKLYATVDNSGFTSGQVLEIDPATLAVTSDADAHQVLGAAGGSGKIYAGDIGGGITVIDEATFTSGGRTDFSGLGWSYIPRLIVF